MSNPSNKRVAVYLTRDQWTLITSGLSTIAVAFDQLHNQELADDARILEKHIKTELDNLEATGKDENS